MSPPLRRKLTPSAVLCGAFGVLGWAFYVISFKREPLQDWMVYYGAGRAYWDGNLALLFDGYRFTDNLNQRFGDWLSWPLPLHPWLYPPHFLLLLLPFATVPFALGYALFIAATGAFLTGVLWSLAENRDQRRLYLLSLLLCPATAITVCLGQNAFLTAALLLGGFAWQKRYPVLASVLLGLLTYKPQLWLMVPVALIAARQWNVAGRAALTALIAATISVAVIGIEPWRGWIEIMTGPSELYRSWLVAGRLNGQSVYTCAALLGASEGLANVLQAIATAGAAACVYWTFRRPLALKLQLAMLLAATVLAAPHIIAYDAIMLGLAATLLFGHALETDLRFGDALLCSLLWLSPLINPPSVFRIGLVTPLLIALFIAWMMARARFNPPQPSPLRKLAPQ
jgi:alpha-1,2-mannosyltransferase